MRCRFAFQILADQRDRTDNRCVALDHDMGGIFSEERQHVVEAIECTQADSRHRSKGALNLVMLSDPALLQFECVVLYVLKGERYDVQITDQGRCYRASDASFACDAVSELGDGRRNG